MLDFDSCPTMVSFLAVDVGISGKQLLFMLYCVRGPAMWV